MANEVRLIDANALLALVQYRLQIDDQNGEVIAGCVDITRRLIKNAPTVDAVEVVRCKDCKHLEITGCYGECRKLVRIVKPWDYCSHGERAADL